MLEFLDGRTRCYYAERVLINRGRRDEVYNSELVMLAKDMKEFIMKNYSLESAQYDTLFDDCLFWLTAELHTEREIPESTLMEKVSSIKRKLHPCFKR